jgi:hypothetical protein
MDHRGRMRRIELTVAAERERRIGEGADLCGEDWRRRCEAFHVLSLSPAEREAYLTKVRLARPASAALRLMDDSVALEREIFATETEDAFEDLFA